MELEESIESLLSQSEHVAEENDRLKKVLCSVMQENQELRGRVRRSKNNRMYSFTNDTTEQLRGGVVRPPAVRWQSYCSGKGAQVQKRSDN